MLYQDWWAAGRVVEIWLSSMAFLMQFHAVNGLALYLTSCSITKSGYRALLANLEAISHCHMDDGVYSLARPYLIRTLTKCRRDHLLLGDVASLIEKCFSSVLLLWICYVFLSFVPCSYYFVSGMVTNSNSQTVFIIDKLTMWSLLTLIKLTFEICVITSVTSSMINEVFKFRSLPHFAMFTYKFCSWNL